MFSYLWCILGMQDEFPARDAEVIKAVRIQGKAKSPFQNLITSTPVSRSGESAARVLTSPTHKT